jgi:hypothetical protein
MMTRQIQPKTSKRAGRRAVLGVGCAAVLLVMALTAAGFAADNPADSSTTRPVPGPEIPLPGQFLLEDQLLLDLARAPAGTEMNVNGAPECVGTISVGGLGSDRKFPLRGRLEAGVLKGDFTDEAGNTFSFIARCDADTDFLIFQTGRTTWKLPRAQGSSGIYRMSLVSVSDGFQIQGLRKDGPADRAGIQSGDVITAIDGKNIAGADPMSLPLRGYAGTGLNLTVRRLDGSTKIFQLKLEPFERQNFGGGFPQGIGVPIAPNDGRGRSRGR